MKQECFVIAETVSGRLCYLRRFAVDSFRFRNMPNANVVSQRVAVWGAMLHASRSWDRLFADISQGRCGGQVCDPARISSQSAAAQFASQRCDLSSHIWHRRMSDSEKCQRLYLWYLAASAIPGSL